MIEIADSSVVVVCCCFVSVLFFFSSLQINNLSDPVLHPNRYVAASDPEFGYISGACVLIVPKNETCTCYLFYNCPLSKVHFELGKRAASIRVA